MISFTEFLKEYFEEGIIRLGGQYKGRPRPDNDNYSIHSKRYIDAEARMMPDNAATRHVQQLVHRSLAVSDKEKRKSRIKPVREHFMESWKITSANDNPKKPTSIKKIGAPASFHKPKINPADEKYTKYDRNFLYGKRTNDNWTWSTYNQGKKMQDIFKVPTTPPLEVMKKSLKLSDKEKRKSKFKVIKKEDK